MDPEVKRELDEVKALVRDNHRILRAIRRDQWIGFVSKIVFWLIALAIPFYLYQQYLQPIVAKFTTTTGMAPSGFLGLPTSAELQKLLNSYKMGQ